MTVRALEGIPTIRNPPNDGQTQPEGAHVYETAGRFSERGDMAGRARWKLKVEHLMACNCNWGCPCSFNAPPTYGRCEGALAYRVAEGSVNRVPLDGSKWVLVAAWPGAVHEGNGRGLVYLDERATGAKREALEAIATGTAGGPMRIYMNTLASRPPVKEARIEFRFAGKRSVFGVGKDVRVEFEPMKNPVTGKDHYYTGLLPTGLFTKREDFYSAKVFWVRTAGFDFDYPGRNTELIRSTWRGP